MSTNNTPESSSLHPAQAAGTEPACAPAFPCWIFGTNTRDWHWFKRDESNTDWAKQDSWMFWANCETRPWWHPDVHSIYERPTFIYFIKPPGATPPAADWAKAAAEEIEDRVLTDPEYANAVAYAAIILRHAPASLRADAATATGDKAEWHDPSTKPATASDGDCEGQIWTWQEYFAPDPETEELKSVGFRVKRHGWREASVGWYHRNRGTMLWTRCDLKQMPDPDSARAHRDSGEGET